MKGNLVTESSIHELLSRLGCRHIYTRVDNVRATCPDEHNHSRGMDRRPSFEVLINDDGTSPTNCFACGFHDSAEWIARTHGWNDLAGGFRTDVTGDGYLYIPKTNRGIWEVEEEPLLPPESSLDRYVGKVPRYIIDRGFDIETCKAWQLGYDQSMQRLIFVVRDRLGRLRGISGRALNDHPAKYLHYIWDHKKQEWRPGYGNVSDERRKDLEKWRKKNLLYGEHMVDWDRIPEARRDAVVLVEGHTDSMWLWQLKWCGLAIMGSSISDAQVGTVLRLLPDDGKVVTLGDGDDGGKTMMKSVREKMASKVPCYEFMLEDKKDPQDFSGEQIELCIKYSKAVSVS